MGSLLLKLKKPEIIGLFGIILVTVFLRFFMLSSFPPSLYSDEAVNGINTLQALEINQFKIFYLENNGREGLFINVQAIFVWLFGPQAWVLRFASGLFGTLTVLGLYFLTKELMTANKKLGIINQDSSAQNPQPKIITPPEIESITPYSLFTIHYSSFVALLSSFFLAISFWHINFSRIGFRAITAPFWSVWALYLFFIARNKFLNEENRALKSYLPWSLFAGAVFGLGFSSYIAYRVMPAVIGLLLLYLFWEARKRGVLKSFVVFVSLIVLGVLITASPLLVHYFKVPQDLSGRTSDISIFSSQTPVSDLLGNILKTAGMFNIAGDFNQRHNIAGRPELFWSVGILFLAGTYLASRSVMKKLFRFLLKKPEPEYTPNEIATPAVYFFLLTWLLTAALPVVISNEGIPHALRSILMIPPVFILAGLGAVYLYYFIVSKLQLNPNWEQLRKFIKIFLFLSAILLVVEVYTAYFIVWGENPKTKDAFSYDYNERAYELRALPPELPKYVVYDPGDIGINITQFLTNTATPASQVKKNLYYVPRETLDLINPPMGVYITDLK